MLSFSQVFYLHPVFSTLQTILFYTFILCLWPLVILSYFGFSIYRKIIDIILNNKLKYKYGGLVQVSDAVFLIKDTTKFTITSVLIVKSNKKRDIMEIVRSRLKNKVFDYPDKYPKLTSGLYEYAGYAYWIKNDYFLNDCLKSLQIKPDIAFNEENLKTWVGDISGSPYPKNDKGLWEILVSQRPLENYKKINNIKLFFYIITVGFGKTFKLSQTRKIDQNALHGPSHSGQKIAVWQTEDSQELIPTIRNIKNSISGMKFSYVLMAAVSVGITNYFKRTCQPIPASTTSLITVLLHFPEPDRSKLENKTSVAIIDLPTAKVEKSKVLMETLREVKINAERTKYGDVMTNYFLLAKIAGILPLNLASKIISRGTYTSFITNVPGGSKIEILDGCVLDNIVPFAPNVNRTGEAMKFSSQLNGFLGISFCFLSYDDRLQLGVLVDKAIFSSQQEAQRIADDIFESIKLLDQEIRDYN